MTQVQDLEQWLTYIAALHPQAIDLGLERMHQLAVHFGLTQFSAKVITVAGTNGKGSVVKTLEQLYLHAGYRVGAYTSPHLLHFTERLHINNKPVDQAQWVEAFTQIDRARTQELTFFEFTTLAALLLCQSMSVEVLILEVGLGGRLDAVNVVESDLAIITGIDLDHTEWLGCSREEIGFEKAGIFREGKFAICGDPNPPLSIAQVAKEKNVTLYCYGEDYGAEELNGQMQYFSKKHSLQLPVPPLLLVNVATALQATELLGFPLAEDVLKRAMQALYLPGRYERMDRPYPILLDVAHNPQATRLLAKRLLSESCFGKIYAIVGMRKEKDFRNSLDPLVGVVDIWHTATICSPFAQKAEELSNYLMQQGVRCYTYTTVANALDAVFAVCTARDLIVIFGSFYTVAEAKQKLQG